MMNKPFRISAVLFHLEGTLACPDERTLQLIPGGLKDLSWPDPARGIRNASPRRRARSASSRVEPATTAEWRLHPAARQLFASLRSRGLKLAVFSRLGRRALGRFLKRVGPTLGGPVRRLMRPEEFRPTSRRNPFRTAAKAMQVPAGETLVVSAEGELLEQAAAAGAVTVLVSPGSAQPGRPPSAHFQITDISGLMAVLRLGLALPAGKLPNDWLKAFLAEFEFEDPSLIIHPGVGEDIAAVDVAQEEVLVLKSDPITFATDAIGHYAVLVNANDIATAGAVPRWLLTTLLFPPGSTPSMIWSVVRELNELTRQWGITLCGGHTEVTDAVRRPVISGMMAGTVRRRDLIDKRRMRTGDRILLTKAVAVEGTAIIARESGRKLKALGMAAGEIQSCRGFLERISILPEAGIAASTDGTSAMHDVTEGGIATALEELSTAGGFELRVDVDRIPIFPETRKLSRLLGFDPLGLIGSGSLLICCRPKTAARLDAHLRREGIRVTVIGEVGERGGGVRAFKNGRTTRWRSFEVDEIARLFAGDRRS
jgi:hydrogenase expression/formation protein HypE